MGKKLSQNSVKISKKEKERFNSLIRLLRPKVYITDSSSFKTLVQDLTGNGACSNSVPPQEQIINIPDVLDVDHDDVSTEASVDDSSEALCNNQVLMSDDEFNQLCYQIYSDDTTTTTPTTTTLEGSSEEQVLVDGIDMYSSSSPFQDLESWLLDTDDHNNQGFDPFFNSGYYAQFDHHQQVSIYDYGLEGLL